MTPTIAAYLMKFGICHVASASSAASMPGAITRKTYDLPTGAVIQQIDDVDTTQVTDAPPGWTTPAGGGLHLITDITIDAEGRATQTLGPSYTIDGGGTATIIRTAAWAVYQDAIFQIWTAQGYATGTAPNYTYTLTNPVSISISDADGRPLQQIQAVRSSTSGPLQPTDSFPQSSYTRWTVLQYGDDNLLAAQLVYKLIPISGAGTVGTNYDQSDFGYDIMKRQNRQVTGGGTITRTVYDVRDNPVSVWIGTNDTGATDSDPTGGGAAGNNMVQVSANQYDNGAAGGDNNLTQTTQYVDATTTRLTNFLYDWRDRQTVIQGEVDFYQKNYFDNLDRVYRTERYNGTAAGNLIARSDTEFDDLHRIFSTIRYGVDPTTGTVGNALTDNSWYDPTGNVMMQLPAGALLFNKSAYDGLGRAVTQYVGYYLGEITYAEAGSVAADTIFVQVETSWDDAGNAIQTNTRLRYHDATAIGPLGDPATDPKARVTYVAPYPDAVGRTVAVANYGTNGGAALSRSDTIPMRSDICLVSGTQFDSAGDVQTTTDPAGTVTCFSQDNLGREVERIMNCQGSSSSSGSSSSASGSSGSSGACPPSIDTNVTILTAYNDDGNVSQITAVNTQTGDQITQYVYGTTLSDSGVASSMLNRYEILPDSVGGDDQLAFTYNIQGDVTTKTDQNGTVHAIDYDLLARPTQDRVTTAGTGIDTAVLRIATAYEVRGMVDMVTSYDNATVGSGTIVNQVQLVYNNFGQLVADYQSHSGEVVIGTTPVVQYGYADGSANTVRPTTMTYPNGRILAYDYGPTGGDNDALSRLASIIDTDSTDLVDYTYLGQDTIIESARPEPGLVCTLIGIDGGNDPDTGDIYRGVDRFARVKDLIWYTNGSSGGSSSSSGPANIVERIQHAYDRVGNRLYRAEPADPNRLHDEYYEYDGLNRLKDFERGTLNPWNTGITSSTFAQCWNLDETGNWTGFREDGTGDGLWDLMQNRASNPVNEITLITESTGPAWVTPVYDKAGNMTTMPQPRSITTAYGAMYDAWHRLAAITVAAKLLAEYAYDGLNRKCVKATYNAGAVRETRDYYYSKKWQVLEERVAGLPAIVDQFLWGGRHIDDLVLRDSLTDIRLGERLYCVQDDNWNASAVTALTGHVVERYSYDGYGTPKILDESFNHRIASIFHWARLFTGADRDPTTGLYNCRNRIYHSILGGWITRDPLYPLSPFKVAVFS